MDQLVSKYTSKIIKASARSYLSKEEKQYYLKNKQHTTPKTKEQECACIIL